MAKGQVLTLALEGESLYAVTGEGGMVGEFASSAWSEIITSAAGSPLGISALVILVVGFVILGLVRRDDSGAVRLGAIVLLLLFCGGLVVAASYTVKPTITKPESAVAGSGGATSVPSSRMVDCGTAWSGWIEVGGAVGNPCPSGCSRGEELGQSYRVVGFPPRPQTQHKFQCWRG